MQVHDQGKPQFDSLGLGQQVLAPLVVEQDLNEMPMVEGPQEVLVHSIFMGAGSLDDEAESEPHQVGQGAFDFWGRGKLALGQM